MKLACSMIFACFNYSTSFSSDNFSSFKNLAKLGGETAEIQDYDFTFNRPDLQTFTSCIRNKSKSCESQARSPSQCLTGPSEQTFSQESTQKRATVCLRCEILELLVVQCTVDW